MSTSLIHQPVPEGVEEHTFTVGPMSEAELALYPEKLHRDIASVAAGEKNPWDERVSVYAAGISRALGGVRDAIVGLMRYVLYDRGLLLSDIQMVLARIKEVAQLSDAECSAEFRVAVLGEVVESICSQVTVALSEVFTNHQRHGNRDPRKRVSGRYYYSPTTGNLVVDSCDEGAGFDVASVPDPLAPENLESTHGKGLLLVRKFMDSLEFDGGKSGNIGSGVRMKRNLIHWDDHPGRQEGEPGTELEQLVRGAVEALRKKAKT